MTINFFAEFSNMVAFIPVTILILFVIVYVYRDTTRRRNSIESKRFVINTMKGVLEKLSISGSVYGHKAHYFETESTVQIGTIETFDFVTYNLKTGKLSIIVNKYNSFGTSKGFNSWKDYAEYHRKNPMLQQDTYVHNMDSYKHFSERFTEIVGVNPKEFCKTSKRHDGGDIIIYTGKKFILHDEPEGSSLIKIIDWEGAKYWELKFND